MTLSDWIAGGFREIKSWFKPVGVVELGEDSYKQLAENAGLGDQPLIDIREDYAKSGGERVFLSDARLAEVVEESAMGIDALLFNKNNPYAAANIMQFKRHYKILVSWIDICLQLVASGEVTQERLYTLLSEVQKIDLEEYVERKRN